MLLLLLLLLLLFVVVVVCCCCCCCCCQCCVLCCSSVDHTLLESRELDALFDRILAQRQALAPPPPLSLPLPLSPSLPPTGNSDLVSDYAYAYDYDYAPSAADIDRYGSSSSREGGAREGGRGVEGSFERYLAGLAPSSSSTSSTSSTSSSLHLSRPFLPPPLPHFKDVICREAEWKGAIKSESALSLTVFVIVLCCVVLCWRLRCLTYVMCMIVIVFVC